MCVCVYVPQGPKNSGPSSIINFLECYVRCGPQIIVDLPISIVIESQFKMYRNNNDERGRAVRMDKVFIALQQSSC